MSSSLQDCLINYPSDTLATFIPGGLGTSLEVCRDNNKYGGSVTTMVKWFCCSAFCTNNFRTRNPQGESIKFYRLPRDPEVQASYTRILQTTAKRSRKLSKRQLSTLLGASEEDKQLLTDAQDMVKKLRTENLSLKIKLQNIEQTRQNINKQNEELKIGVKRLQQEQFSYSNLIKKPTTFKYLCGLSVEQFNILWNCVQPYSDVIIYPDCKGTGERSVDKPTELFAVLAICRHSFHQGVMAFMLKVGESTIQRIFVGWIVFLETIFTFINLKPEAVFFLKKMPDTFVKTGHGLTDMIIDCTEFKFQHVSNLDLNSLMFSNYKNTITGKALIGIAPHGMGLFLSDIYPGSISDNCITEKSGVVQWIQPEHELMADRGFAIQDLCALKGIYLNRPAHKL